MKKPLTYFAAVVDNPTGQATCASIRKSAEDALSVDLVGTNPRIVQLPASICDHAPYIMEAIRLSDQEGRSVLLS